MYDMLAARRRIMMAKNKPAFHVWDGSRDYSFYKTGESTLYIESPEQLAALMMISLNYDFADGSGLTNAKSYISQYVSTIKLVNDLYFNSDYENNFEWETDFYPNSSDKENHNNLAYILRGDNQRVSLYFSAFVEPVFDGNFKKIIGLYSSSYSKVLNSFFNYSKNTLKLKNIVFKNCTIKNGRTDKTTADGNALPSLINGLTSSSNNLKNISAQHCMTNGISHWDTNYQNPHPRVLLLNSVESGILKNVSVFDSWINQAWRNEPTSVVSTYSTRVSSGFIAPSLKNAHVDIICSCDNISSGLGVPTRNAYQTSTEYCGNQLPASEAHVYTKGNSGNVTSSRDSSILQTMASKAALIAQLNADITANASGDLSLLDADGNFTGVCP